MRGVERDAVHAVLGDVALCLAAFRGGAPVALRSRRRDRSAGEALRLREEASRAAASAGNGTGTLRLVVSGAGAAGLRRELEEGGAWPALEGPAEWPDAAETAWLGGLVS
jgi:hypothetical protein